MSTDYILGRTDNPSPHNGVFDPMTEISNLLKPYNNDQSGFFHIDKWKTMGPEKIKELESYFEYITSRAKNRNEEDENE